MPVLNRPQAVLIEKNCRANIQKLLHRAEKNHASCRPHFKTHQSHVIGKWFNEAGITSITVSSPQMAAYFCKHGWDDITIAFPFYRAQIDDINELTHESKLRLFVDSAADCKYLSKSLLNPVDIMIEIDAGYNRSGVKYDDKETVKKLIAEIDALRKIDFKGFYIHDGGTYHVRGKKEVKQLIQRDLEAFRELKKEYPNAEFGLGDTPSCSLIDDLSPATELSAGNLIFYDLMQIQIGSCSYNDLGLLVKVPVAQEKPGTDECIVHGGAVHFSKERLTMDGHETYGQPVVIDANGRISKIDGTYIKALSQEHGTVFGLDALKKAYQTDQLDKIWVCPVHSCLTANLFDEYKTLDGKSIQKRILS